MQDTNKIELINIIKNKAIKAVYQPIVSLNNGKIFGYEALSRITVTDCNLNIEELFHLAEKYQKLWDLERLCRKKALKYAVNKPCNTKLFINVDPNIIHDPDIVTGFTQKKLNKYKLDPEDIIFEITERSAIKDIHTFNAAVSHYKSQNFEIAIDDFGSGYSGMNRVCSLSPKYLKLDIQLVRNVHIDIMKKCAIKSIIYFCNEAKIKTIAEGIETRDELKTLIDLGVDYGQGYYFARPCQDFVDINNTLDFNN